MCAYLSSNEELHILIAEIKNRRRLRKSPLIFYELVVGANTHLDGIQYVTIDLNTVLNDDVHGNNIGCFDYVVVTYEGVYCGSSPLH